MKLVTVAVHAGSRASPSKAVPLSAPIATAAVSWFDDADELDQSLDGKDLVYGRIAASNSQLLEEAIAALEGAESCVAYPSGMAALRALYEAQGFRAGDRLVLAADGYGVTRALFEKLAQRDGVEVLALTFTAPDIAERLVAARAKLVVAESVTNPLVQVPDLPLIARAARQAGSKLAVDGTFPSPLGQQTLRLGADYAVQSTTKWINGHSDALGGTVSGTRALLDPMRSARILTGELLGPFEAWLTLRGLRTLPVRLRAHGQNALALARTLEGAQGISRVWYPGLPSHPQHEVAARVLDTGLAGFGGMLAFELDHGTRAQAFSFLESVKLARPAPSLGDVGTLVMHAASASARRLTPEQRAAAGITEGLIRVSVGLEDPADLADDLLNAVQRARE